MMKTITPKKFYSDLAKCQTRLEVFEYLHNNFQFLDASEEVKSQILDSADNLVDGHTIAMTHD